jgi:hypothetical protein
VSATVYLETSPVVSGNVVAGECLQSMCFVMTDAVAKWLVNSPVEGELGGIVRGN